MAGHSKWANIQHRKGRQDEKRGAQGIEPVERVEVVGHVAVGRVDHGGAAVEDVVPAEQQAVFAQDQAQMVGCVAGGVHHLQGMGDFALQRFTRKRQQLIIL